MKPWGMRRQHLVHMQHPPAALSPLLPLLPTLLYRCHVSQHCIFDLPVHAAAPRASLFVAVAAAVVGGAACQLVFAVERRLGFLIA